MRHSASMSYPVCDTKPNLVAKILPPTLVTICAWLPKLVAKVSFQFLYLVNAGLVVGSLVKWLPVMVAHTCKLDTIWVFNPLRAILFRENIYLYFMSFLHTNKKQVVEIPPQVIQGPAYTT